MNAFSKIFAIYCVISAIVIYFADHFFLTAMAIGFCLIGTLLLAIIMVGERKIVK